MNSERRFGGKQIKLAFQCSMVTALVARVKITLRRASWKHVLTGHPENDSLLADFCARAFHHLCRQQEKNSVVKQTHSLEGIFLREEKH